MDQSLTITTTREQGRVPVTVFHVKGVLNTNSYEQLQSMADQAHTEGMCDLLLDLSEVPYVSSAGLRALNHIFVLLRTNAPGEGDDAMSKGLRDGTFKSPHLKLLNPSPTVREVIRISGFDMLLEIHSDLKKAVASF